VPHVIRPFGGESGLSHHIHQIRATSEQANGHTAAQRFAVRQQIGLHPVITRRTGQAKAEAGDDLIEDQRNAVPRAQCAQTGQKVGHWRQTPVKRLHNNSGQ
jgi:hypothetical protein